MILSAIAIVAAFLLRYLAPGRVGLAFGSGGVIRGVPLNVAAFWALLALAVFVLLARLAVSILARR